MTDINNLFFELIQVAIGTRVCLSHSPTGDEWKVLYEMAKKQSLVGVCFAGVQRLQKQRQDPTSTGSAQAEMLYLTWMGMAAKIQQRNELMKAKGDRLLSEFQNCGMDAYILKGQTVASLYKVSSFTSTGSAQAQEFQVSSDMSLLRQSGDIDVWVKNRSVMELDAYVKGLGLKPHTTAAHVSYEDAGGFEIELHATPAFIRDFRTNRKLVKWFKEFNGSTTEFNLVYMMVHMYHHVLFEGLGLRQLMDYYFVLRAANKEVSDGFKVFQEVSGTIESLGMKNFASGILWVIDYVFGDMYFDRLSNHTSETLKPFETTSLMPSEKYGRLILEDVMTGGNFGHHGADIQNLHSESALGRLMAGLKRNMKFFALGPWEIMCTPLWSVWHYVWRKRRGYYE